MKKKIVRPHIPAMVNRTERWLQEQASNGWRLTRYNHWIFVFQKCKPYDTHYLMYSSFDKSKGLSYDYLRIKQKYKKAKSQINQAPVAVFEADNAKVDSDYYRFIGIRNKFYITHYIRLSWVSSICAGIALCIVLGEIQTWFLLLLCLVAFAYAFISFLILRKDAAK